MPASLKLKEEYGDDLAVLFVHSQQGTPTETGAFALKRKWLGQDALWTHERPVRVPGNSLPKFALLGRDGTVLAFGNPLAKKKQIEELIATEVKSARGADADVPKKLRKAWKQYSKDSLTKAFAAARKVRTDAEASEDTELVEAADATLARFEAGTQSRLDRIERLLTEGFIADAGRRLGAVKKALKGEADFEERIAGLGERLESPELAKERGAEEALARITKKAYAKGADPKVAKQLAKFAEEHAGTRAAERAATLARFASL